MRPRRLVRFAFHVSLGRVGGSHNETLVERATKILALLAIHRIESRDPNTPVTDLAATRWPARCDRRRNRLRLMCSATAARFFAFDAGRALEHRRYVGELVRMTGVEERGREGISHLSRDDA